jgi:ABC-2 type transport system permease protein
MDPGSLVVIVGLPAMYLLLQGTMFAAVIPSAELGGVNYITFLAPGIVAFQTVMAGTVGGGMLWSDRRYGMFSQILSGPFSRSQYLLGIITATMGASLAGAALMIALSVPLGLHIVFSLPGMGLVLLNLIVGGIFFCSLMLCIAARVTSNNAYNSIQILILFVINFVADVFYPLTPATPKVLYYAAYLNPLTYISDGVRNGFGVHSNLFIYNPIETVVLIAETLFFFLLAYRTYTRVDVSTS